MLDTDTKRRIDAARDILVGKVPDPKSQVEQITLALLYKFMDDIDAQSEELGGQRKFFADDFDRFGWAKLMRLGGNETLNLYAEGIAAMPKNESIPPLFRDIFKNAFLPYRDPETLRHFLKIIDEFEYDHSERLGDAYEYLLSVLGSQGDAGQFRTPRHIIDFMVAVIDPKKDETILDPACGTAGFLISSYKHIQTANRDEQGQSTLTPDERERLADNLKGYDISPDMVRLSRMNMYLHGFVEPHIFEYDTLTAEDRWSERADVILANPPFMSPKGGIRPHNRFSVQSKRSEVLFTDYIAEHLTPAGRAAVIVPEGIIFQSQNAHKQLRKLLVENYLVAVVSLPAGVFQPYSGVKTSILILDRPLAKKIDRIAFFKVEQDGYDLGAKRTPVDRNDLPRVRAELTEYLNRLRAGQPADQGRRVAEPKEKYSARSKKTKQGLIAEKAKIAADGEYNLSGERYRDVGGESIRVPMVKLGDVASVLTGNSAPQDKTYFVNGEIPFVRTSDVGKIKFGKISATADNLNPEGASNLKVFPRGSILFPKSGASTLLNHRVMLEMDACVSSHLAVIKGNEATLDVFLLYILSSVDAANLVGNSSYPSLNTGVIKNIKIPLPPLETQQSIVAEIEGYQKIIHANRQLIERLQNKIQTAVSRVWNGNA